MTKDTNRLSKFFLYSLLIHTILIFSLSFKWYTKRLHASQAVDITLINTKSKEKPDNPDYLANNNNIGGGDSKEKNVPTNQYKATFPDEQIKEIITPQNEQIVPLEQANLINKKDNSIKTINQSKDKTLDSPSINKLVTEQRNKIDFIVQPQIESQFSSLISKIALRYKLFANQPKKRFVSARSQEYRDAEYLAQWRSKIEYMGNKYYPEQAKERNLAGEVLLLVAVRHDGSVESINIERSSGIKILDEAAVQTVHLAAPFKPFTKEMRKDTDILEIVRTWRFNKGELSTN